MKHFCLFLDFEIVAQNYYFQFEIFDRETMEDRFTKWPLSVCCWPYFHNKPIFCLPSSIWAPRFALLSPFPEIFVKKLFFFCISDRVKLTIMIIRKFLIVEYSRFHPIWMIFGIFSKLSIFKVRLSKSLFSPQFSVKWFSLKNCNLGWKIKKKNERFLRIHSNSAF